MPVRSEYNKENNFVEVVYTGNISNEELIEAVLASVHLAREKGSFLFLADCTKMTGGHSIVDLYELISLYEKLEIPRNMREAIILPVIPEPVDKVRFYETASTNRGYTVRIFDDREQALVWLISK